MRKLFSSPVVTFTLMTGALVGLIGTLIVSALEPVTPASHPVLWLSGIACALILIAVLHASPLLRRRFVEHAGALFAQYEPRRTDMLKVIVKDIEVLYEPCEHCDRVPAQEDIEAALRLELEAHERPGMKCVICGQTPRLASISIYHYRDHGQDRWGSRHGKGEPVVGVTIGGCHDFRAHLRCIRKALPFADLTDPYLAVKES